MIIILLAALLAGNLEDKIKYDKGFSVDKEIDELLADDTEPWGEYDHDDDPYDEEAEPQGDISDFPGTSAGVSDGENAPRGRFRKNRRWVRSEDLSPPVFTVNLVKDMQRKLHLSTVLTLWVLEVNPASAPIFERIFIAQLG